MSALTDDTINFDNFQSNLCDKLNLDNWIVVSCDRNIYIFNLNKQISGNLTIRNTISIDCAAPIVNVFVNNDVTKSTFTLNVKINQWSQLQKLIDNLKINVEHRTDIGCGFDNVIVGGSVIKVEPGMEHEGIEYSEFCSTSDGELFDEQREHRHKTKQEEPSIHPEIESCFLKEIKIEPTNHCITNEKDAFDTTCSECGKKFDQHMKLMLHMKLHDPRHCEICPICSKSLPGRYMKKHIQAHNKTPGNIQNDDSAVSMDQRPVTELMKSTAIIDEEQKNLTHVNSKFYCDICKDGRDHKTKSKIHSHMRSHMGKFEMTSHIVPTSRKCPTCGKEFSQYRQLSLHLRRHNRSLWKVCPICKKSFPDGLTRHMNSHLKIKNHVCDVCGLAYAQASSLKTHMEANHLEGIEFFCDICKNGRNYRSRDYLKKHLLSHSSENKRKSYNRKPSNRSTPKTKNFHCVQCDSRFVANCLLKQHILSAHTNEKQFQCEQCHKKFAYRNLLRIHKQVHSTVKKHTCEICGKSFSLANYLRKHIPRHNGLENKRKMCSMCNKRYVTIQDLRLHMMKVHGVELKTKRIIPNK